MIQDLYEHNKRDASNSGSSGSDDSSSSSSSSSSADDTTPLDECALLGNYIATDLATLPITASGPIDLNLVSQVATALFALMTSAPTLFADLSAAIDAAANELSGPAGVDPLTELSPEFVALATDSCGMTLSPDLIANVDVLFIRVLPTFFFFVQ